MEKIIRFARGVLNALRTHRDALECAGIAVIGGWLVAYATYLLKC